MGSCSQVTCQLEVSPEEEPSTAGVSANTTSLIGLESLELSTSVVFLCPMTCIGVDYPDVSLVIQVRCE